MAAAKKEKTLAGYVDEARGVFRDHGGALASGTKRTCVADALWVLLQELECTAMLGDVRASIMPDNPDEDTLFTAAADYAVTLSFVLACVSKEFQQGKGGLEFHLLSRDHGYFLVQLRVTTGPTDPEPPDLHVVAYDGKTIRDNNKYTKVPYSSPYPSPYPCPHLTSLTLGENPRAVRSDQGGRAPRARLSLQWPRGAH